MMFDYMQPIKLTMYSMYIPRPVVIVSYNECLTISAGVTVVNAQLGVASEKPVFVSSQGGTPVDNPMSNANDQFLNSAFYTEDLPWSFVAVDMEDLYEIDRMELKVKSDLSKLNQLVTGLHNMKCCHDRNAEDGLGRVTYQLRSSLYNPG